MSRWDGDLESWIDTLPSNGEWRKPDGRMAYLEGARQLIAVGMAQDDVIALLGKLYAAVANEYGE